MNFLKLLFLLIGVLLFGLILKETDLHAVWAEITKIGWWGIAAVLFIYAVAFLADVTIWLMSLPSLPFNLLWLKRLYLVRMAGQAFNYVTPLASVGGEPLKALMLKNHYNINYKNSAISLVVAKTADMFGLIVFLLIGFFVLYFSPALGSSYKMIAGVGLVALTLASIGFFLVQRLKITSISARWLSKTKTGQKLDKLLGIIHQLDDQLVEFYTQHRERFIITLALALFNWTLGVVEIYFVMIFLGHPITISDALIIESMAQLVRAGTFFIPASIGAQEGAFFLVCNALTGIPELGVAIAMIRRFREIIWISAGMLIWWLYSLKPEIKAS